MGDPQSHPCDVSSPSEQPRFILALSFLLRILRPRVNNFLYGRLPFGLASTPPAFSGYTFPVADTGANGSGWMPCQNHDLDDCCWLFAHCYPCDGYSPIGPS